jgi:hypothetical protein
MRVGKGRRLSTHTMVRVQRLLAQTDLTISEIAESVDQSRSAVLSVNRRFRIRAYIGRAQWVVSKDWELKAREKAG